MKDSQKHLCFETVALGPSTLVYAPLNNNGFVSSASYAIVCYFTHRRISLIWGQRRKIIQKTSAFNITGYKDLSVIEDDFEY
jgi:hypothetical protein